MSERLIQTDGCYAAIFDVRSPVNVAGNFHEIMRKANRQAMKAQQGWSALFRFNDHWIEAAGRGEILAWVLLFDGVFKVEATVLASSPIADPPREQTCGFLGQQYHPLACPSGHIVAASLSDLGNRALEPLVVVAPGTYHVVLRRNDDQEVEHSFLTDAAQYPPGDGPDWSIDLWSV